jgi:hypothetical protein
MTTIFMVSPPLSMIGDPQECDESGQLNERGNSNTDSKVSTGRLAGSQKSCYMRAPEGSCKRATNIATCAVAGAELCCGAFDDLR